jgi:hypothetical protein
LTVSPPRGYLASLQNHTQAADTSLVGYTNPSLVTRRGLSESVRQVEYRFLDILTAGENNLVRSDCQQSLFLDSERVIATLLAPMALLFESRQFPSKSWRR